MTLDDLKKMSLNDMREAANKLTDEELSALHDEADKDSIVDLATYPEYRESKKDPKYADVYFIQTDACAKGSHEYSVDGTHPDDHGYYLWSKSIEKPILAILAKYGIK